MTRHHRRKDHPSWTQIVYTAWLKERSRKKNLCHQVDRNQLRIILRLKQLFLPPKIHQVDKCLTVPKIKTSTVIYKPTNSNSWWVPQIAMEVFSHYIAITTMIQTATWICRRQSNFTKMVAMSQPMRKYSKNRHHREEYKVDRASKYSIARIIKKN